MADVFGIEKVWGSLYESCRQHGDFATKRSNSQRVQLITGLWNIVRDEKFRATMVGRARQSRIRSQHRCWNDAAYAQMCETERAPRMRLLYCLGVVLHCIYVY